MLASTARSLVIGRVEAPIGVGDRIEWKRDSKFGRQKILFAWYDTLANI
jgi:hypothetical protein